MEMLTSTSEIGGHYDYVGDSHFSDVALSGLLLSTLSSSLRGSLLRLRPLAILEGRLRRVHKFSLSPRLQCVYLTYSKLCTPFCGLDLATSMGVTVCFPSLF